MHVLGFFVENQMTIAAWVCVWVFYYICLHDCFYASIMLFLSLWLCSIVWSQILW
jgi:hypothetical protein